MYIEIDDCMQTKEPEDKDSKHSNIQIYWMIDRNLLPANDSMQFDQWTKNINDFNFTSDIHMVKMWKFDQYPCHGCSITIKIRLHKCK